MARNRWMEEMFTIDPKRSLKETKNITSLFVGTTAVIKVLTKISSLIMKITVTI